MVDSLKKGVKCLWKRVSESETTDGEGIRQTVKEHKDYKGNLEQDERCLKCDGYDNSCFRYKLCEIENEQ